MENNKRDIVLFKRIEQNFILQIVVCIILCILVIMAFFVANSAIDERNSRKFTITNDINLINQIEDIYIDNKNINIKGYAFLQNMSSEDTEIDLILRNVNNGKEIWPNVTQISREDVNSYFKSDYNYINSGFNASVKKSKINIDECYEIIIKLDFKENSNNGCKTVLTNIYITDGKLYTYNPYEIRLEDMKVESELLNEVFINGQLLFYQNEIGMYVYQYKNKLYWVANKNFNLEEDGLTHMIFHLYTSQVDKSIEQQNTLGFDILDFYFEECEYIDENTSPYRVAVRDIPDKNSITYIKTGVLDTVNNKWLWYNQFQLSHIFD